MIHQDKAGQKIFCEPGLWIHLTCFLAFLSQSVCLQTSVDSQRQRHRFVGPTAGTLSFSSECQRPWNTVCSTWGFYRGHQPRTDITLCYLFGLTTQECFLWVTAFPLQPVADSVSSAFPGAFPSLLRTCSCHFVAVILQSPHPGQISVSRITGNRGWGCNKWKQDLVIISLKQLQGKGGYCCLVTSFAVSVFVFLFLNKMFKYFLYMQ